MVEMIKYPSINQFRHLVKNVRSKVQYVGKDETGEPIMNRNAKLPTVPALCTVKLHGTNAAIHLVDGELVYQSRNRLLSLGSDNAGFVANMSQKPIKEWLQGFGDDVMVYGEWCGGNIQSKVAIHGLPLMFVVFHIVVDGVVHSTYKHFSNDMFKDIREHGIYSILDFQHWIVNLDFNEPELAQNRLVEIMQSVEKECPVGKFFGKSGIGEGIVVQLQSSEFAGSDFWCKVKGDEHSNSKVRTTNAVDVEVLNSIKEFVQKVVTEQRLEQGVQYLQEMNHPVDEKSIGIFIKWVYNDVVKEESDTIAAMGIDPKQVGKHVSGEAKRWFIEKLEEM